MGNSNSSRTEALIEENRLEAEAMHKFNYRVRTYSYPHHGPYHEYIEWCRAQYELDCLPDYCKHGHAYSGN
jgi:hypothetical protein